jgi:hypothetical protein
MDYVKLTLARFRVRLMVENRYKNVTAARRAVGKASFGPIDRERAYRLVNLHFKAELEKKRRERELSPKGRKRARVPLPKGPRPLRHASGPRLDWDPVVLADAIVDRILGRLRELIAHFLGLDARSEKKNP